MQELGADKVCDDFIFLEAPKWRDGKLWVSAVFDRSVFSIAPDGARTLVAELPKPNCPNGIGFLPDGSLIIASGLQQKLLRVANGQTSVYADLSGHLVDQVNDFAIDAEGRVFVGAFGYDYFAGAQAQESNLVRVDPDGSIETVASGLEFPNGAVFLYGGKLLVVAETWRGRLTAFDVKDGRLYNKRTFADLAGRLPDGVCADAEGAIWTGSFNTGEFLRVLDGGAITHRVKLEGSCCVSCVLGGESGRELFMTAFMGTPDRIAAGKRLGAVYKTRVEVGAP